jgi:thioredoxin reductase (NADPH)
MSGRTYDCIIIGAGPGGLQAAIYLARYNRGVLLIDWGGGRTRHAKSIENVLTHRRISGTELIERGLEQARIFNVEIVKGRVTSVKKDGPFTVATAAASYRSLTVVAASGVSDNFPPLENLYRFLGVSYFTCVDCDGYKTTNKKLAVVGDSLGAVNLALAMKRLYTRDVIFFPYRLDLPGSFADILKEEGIPTAASEPTRLIGDSELEALELADGTRVPCEAVMASFGYRLNDEYLAGLPLKKDAEGRKYVVGGACESSVSGLYIVGPLNTGNDQVVIAAGEGATAAIDINKRLLEKAWSSETGEDGAGAPEGADR